jgi:hypothetical protein
VVLRAIPLARGALELAPEAAIGMAVGAPIAQPEPARDSDSPCEDRRAARCPPGGDGGWWGGIGSDGTGSAGGGCAAARSHRAQGGLLVRPSKGLGAVALGLEGFGLRGCAWSHHTWLGLSEVPEDENPEECN